MWYTMSILTLKVLKCEFQGVMADINPLLMIGRNTFEKSG
jgi:hypothetical protein